MTKKFINLFITAFLLPFIGFSQITGKVVDAENGEGLPMSNVQVVETKKVLTTDLEGNFKISGLEKGTYTIEFSYIGYVPTKKTVEYNGEKVELGNIEMGTEAVGIKEVEVFSSIVSEQEAAPTAISNVTAEQIDQKMGAQEFPEMMKSTPGVFVSTEGGGFGSSDIRIRGFDSENTAVLINGIPVNDMESGRVFWSNWGGMNDVTRNQQVQRGLGASKLAVSSVGGTINIITKPTQQRKGFKLSYASANRSYQHRIMASYSTGKLKNGWAFTALGSTRQGWGYMNGTKTEAYSYFLSAYKEFGENHQLMITAFGAPQKTWRGSGASELAYFVADTTGYVYDQFNNVIETNGLNPRFNPGWGYDDGEKRSARISRYHKPMAMANHYWNLSDNWELATSGYLSWGTGGGTNIDRMPGTMQPINYFLTPGTPSNQFQIQWDTLQKHNQNNITTISAINGTDQSITGARSQYILNDSRNDHFWTGFISNANGKIGEKTELTFGIDHRWFRGHHYQVLTDLMGGDFWVDRSRFGNSAGALYDNNALVPNHITYEGDTIGYNYKTTVTWSGLFAQAQHNVNDKLSLFGTATYSYSRFYRNGLMLNAMGIEKDTATGEYSQSSLGLSPVYNFHNYTVKGGATYKFNGRHSAYLNGGYFTRAPFVRTAFLDNRWSNNAITKFYDKGLDDQLISSFEVGYRYKSPKFAANLNVYHTEWNNRSDIIRVWTADIGGYANYIMYGIGSTHEGIEMDFKASVIRNLSITGMLSIGDWRYNSDAQGVLATFPTFNTIDENGDGEVDLKPLYIKDLKVGGAAQTTSSLGFFYRGRGYYYVGGDANYFGHMYKDFNPANKTNDLQYFNQVERMPDAITMDIYAGKSWKFNFKERNVFLKLKANINNVTNNSFMIRSNEGAKSALQPNAVGFASFYFGRTYFLALELNM